MTRPFTFPSTLNRDDLFKRYGLFPEDNVQVTSGNSNQARSESVIAVNPRNKNNLIAASKKFSNPKTYRNTIGVRVSLDGGNTWQDATLPTLPEWGDMVGVNGMDATSGMTDPAVVFDDFGNAFMVGEPVLYHPNLRVPDDIETLGMYLYKSSDGGLSWNAPIPLHVRDKDDDKSWITCDNNPASPHYGNIYVVWGASSPLRFARSTDHGVTWKGVGNQPVASQLTASTYAPEISIGLDGTVHIAWHSWVSGRKGANGTIFYMRSADGGETFEGPKPIVENVWSLRGNLPESGSLVGKDGQVVTWPHFPGAAFRVITLATGCGFGFDPTRRAFHFPFISPKNFMVAWSDFREGAARIYCQTSSNSGISFDGPQSGRPLLEGQSIDKSLHHFHPQLVSTGSGVVGCTYYEYKEIEKLIDVKLSASFDRGKTFSHTVTVNDRSWNPAVDAPWAHGDPQVTFIGEYFGLDAHDDGFDVLWTDTRTGVQELFYDRVATETTEIPRIFEGIIAEILFGVIQGGDGVVIVNGHIIRIPPRGPVYDLAQAIVALDAAGNIDGLAGRNLTKSVFDAVKAIAGEAGRSFKA